MPPIDLAIYLGLWLAVAGLCVAELVWVRRTARHARRARRGFAVTTRKGTGTTTEETECQN